VKLSNQFWILINEWNCILNDKKCRMHVMDFLFIFGINAFENTQGNVTKLERQLDMVT